MDVVDVSCASGCVAGSLDVEGSTSSSTYMDPDTRPVQSPDCRRESPAYSHHHEVQSELGGSAGRRRRRYDSTRRPLDLGPRPSDFHVGSRAVDEESPISAGQLGISSSPASGNAIVSPPRSLDSLPTDSRFCATERANGDGRSVVDVTLPSRGVSYFSLNFGDNDEMSDRSMLVVSGPQLNVAESCRVLDPSCSSATSPCGSQLISSSLGADQPTADPVPTSSSIVGSNYNSVVRCSSAAADADEHCRVYHTVAASADTDEASSRDSGYRTGPNNALSATSGLRRSVSGAEMVQNCCLSARFASDADLEADLLSARLLREFREAIKSAVDSISADRCRPPSDVELYRASPRPQFTAAAAQSFVSVEHFGELGSRPSCVLASRNVSTTTTTVEARTEPSSSSFRQLRLSNIPTLNGVARCRPSQPVRDDSTAAVERRVTPSVLRHRRSLPDASQLRSLSSSRDAVMPSRPAVRTRSSLAIGTCV